MGDFFLRAGIDSLAEADRFPLSLYQTMITSLKTLWHKAAGEFTAYGLPILRLAHTTSDNPQEILSDAFPVALLDQSN